MPLSVSSGPSTWISDFVHSTDSRFKGKNKKERTRMALGAYYAKKRESNSLVNNVMDLLELDNSGIKTATSPSAPAITPGSSTVNSQGMSTSDPSTLGMNPSTTPSMATSTSLSQPPTDLGSPATKYVTGGTSSASTTSTLTTGADSLLGTHAAPSSTSSAGSSSYTQNTKPKTLSTIGSSSTVNDSLIEIETAIRVCPKCGKTGTDPYMSKNHFSNCHNHQKATQKPASKLHDPAEI